MNFKEWSETLKTLGPLGMSVVVGLLVISIPLAIQLDDRYAKDRVLQERMAETNKKLEEQVGHLQQINGQFKMLLTVMLPQPASTLSALPVLPTTNLTVGPSPTPALSASQMAAIEDSKPKDVKLLAVKNQVAETDAKIKSTLSNLVGK